MPCSRGGLRYAGAAARPHRREWDNGAGRRKGTWRVQQGQAIYLAILLVAFALLITEKLRNDVVAVLVILALFVTHSLDARAALSGFSSEPAIVVAAIFVMTGALHQTGVSDLLSSWIGRWAGSSYTRAIAVIMPSVALLSAFTHHVTTTAAMLPVTTTLAREKNIPASRLLMPLSFAASLGTTITIIGAPAFLVASNILRQAGRPGLGIFSIAPLGLSLSLIGTVYVLLVGRWLLPARRGQSGADERFRLEDYFTELKILEDSALVGKTVEEVEGNENYHFRVAGWVRRGRRIYGPYGERTIEPGDVLLVRTSPEDIVAFREERGLELAPVSQYGVPGMPDLPGAPVAPPEQEAFPTARPANGRLPEGPEGARVAEVAGVAASHSDEMTSQPDGVRAHGRTAAAPAAVRAAVALAAHHATTPDVREAEDGDAADLDDEDQSDSPSASEIEDVPDLLAQAVVAPNSDLAGRTLSQVDFRRRYGALVVGLWRKDGLLQEELSKTHLRPGDVLVLVGNEEALDRVRRDRAFLMLVPFQGEVRRRRKMLVAAGVMLFTIASASLGWLTLDMAAVAGALLMVLLGCVTARQAYRSVDAKIFVFIAGAIPLGDAMEKTGTSELLAGWLKAAVGGWNPVLILMVMYVIVAVLTQFMSDAGTVALIGPIAAAFAASLGLPPEPFVVTCAMASVVAFLTPIGHHGNLLIYGPGRYQFGDFVRVGTPLTIISGVVVSFLTLALWHA